MFQVFELARVPYIDPTRETNTDQFMRRIEVSPADGTKLEIEAPLVTNLRIGEEIGLDILDGVIFRDG